MLERSLAWSSSLALPRSTTSYNMSGVCFVGVEDQVVTVQTGPKESPVFYKTDLNQLQHLGPLYYSKHPQSPFYVSPQKRELLRRYISFLTPTNIKKYLVDFVRDHKPCSLRRVYYLCTNFCRKYPKLTTYQITRRDIMTGDPIVVTIVLWEEYDRHLRDEPRYINDCFQRRKRRSSDQTTKHKDIVLCRVGPNEFVTTASIQIVFLHMIHSVQLLDQVPRWLDLLVEDHRSSIIKRNTEVAECAKKGTPYRRRALNPGRPARGAPVQSYST